MNSTFICFYGIKKIEATIHPVTNQQSLTRECICTLSIVAADSSITIHFDTPDELIAMCNKHNITLRDYRNPKTGETA